MNTTQLLEIHPKELEFIFEVKKQSSCSVRLTNTTSKTIAFKVKTTSPKKYCVRPNVGLVMPKSTLDFTVTMQAQKVAPPDMMCKDKFLIQSVIVPSGTMEEDITADMFLKDDGKYVEEVKLRVSLVSPPQSPVLSPINGDLKLNPFFENATLNDQPIFTKGKLHSPKSPNDVEWRTNYSEEFHTVGENELKPMRSFQEPKHLKMDNHYEFTEQKDKDLSPVKDESKLPAKTVDDLSPVMDDHKFHGNKVGHLTPTLDGHELPAKKAEDLTHVVNDYKFPGKKVEDLISAMDNHKLFAKKGEDLTHVMDEDNLSEMKAEDLTPITDGLKLAEKKAENVTQGEFVVHDENLRPQNVEEMNPREDADSDDQLKLSKDAKLFADQLKPPKNAESFSQKDMEFVHLKAMGEHKLVGDIEEMKSKLNALELKLNEAESIILKLTEERRMSIRESEVLQQQLAVLRSKTSVKRVHNGFPLLFVVMVAFISLVLGYLSHS